MTPQQWLSFELKRSPSSFQFCLKLVSLSTIFNPTMMAISEKGCWSKVGCEVIKPQGVEVLITRSLCFIIWRYWIHAFGKVSCDANICKRSWGPWQPHWLHPELVNPDEEALFRTDANLRFDTPWI